MKKSFLSMIALCLAMHAISQSHHLKFSAYDGIIVGGYVDNGGYFNLCGPNVFVATKKSKYILSMLPSLRFKEDHAAVKNSFVTPSLGFGFTYCYKGLAIQIPLYYNSKTAIANGQWNMGIGIGWRVKY